jgi:hypothetical protein
LFQDPLQSGDEEAKMRNEKMRILSRAISFAVGL